MVLLNQLENTYQEVLKMHFLKIIKAASNLKYILNLKLLLTSFIKLLKLFIGEFVLHTCIVKWITCQFN